MTRGPRAKTRPASTLSPTFTGIGIGSPVRGALSIAPVPSMITPSTGTVSPDLTSIISPTSSASTGTRSLSQSLAEDGSKEAVLITLRDLVPLISIGLLSVTTLALLGSLSRPPCIDCLALINALFSRWEANATSETTIRASISSPSAIAPNTARDVRTWNPTTRFFSPAMASWNS